MTSSTWSPYQVCGVGIALLDNSAIGPGTVIDVECIDNKIHKGFTISDYNTQFGCYNLSKDGKNILSD